MRNGPARGRGRSACYKLGASLDDATGVAGAGAGVHDRGRRAAGLRARARAVAVRAVAATTAGRHARAELVTLELVGHSVSLLGVVDVPIDRVPPGPESNGQGVDT